MIDAKGPYRVGALFVALSGLVHLLALFVSGFASGALVLVPAGIVYLGFAYGLLQGWRWLAYVTFLIMLIGISATMTGIWAISPVPPWIYIAIALAHACAVVALFVALWRPRPTAPSV